jgi:hypothetical protein
MKIMWYGIESRPALNHQQPWCLHVSRRFSLCMYVERVGRNQETANTPKHGERERERERAKVKAKAKAKEPHEIHINII